MSTVKDNSSSHKRVAIMVGAGCKAKEERSEWWNGGHGGRSQLVRSVTHPEAAERLKCLFG